MKVVFIKGEQKPKPEKAPRPSRAKLHLNKEFIHASALEILRLHNLKFAIEASKEAKVKRKENSK